MIQFCTHLVKGLKDLSPIVCESALKFSPVETLFALKKLAIGQAALQKIRRAHCDRLSLYRYCAVVPDVKDEFQESQTIQIITGLDSSVTAACL